MQSLYLGRSQDRAASLLLFKAIAVFYTFFIKNMPVISSPFEQLYRDRCMVIDGELKPTFWNPQPIPYEPLCLYGDEDNATEEAWNCEPAISRLIALGFELELEVGEFIREAGARDLPTDPYLKKLLQSNVADEAKHYKGFVYAKEAFPVPEKDLLVASGLRMGWQQQAEIEHPLLVAMALEIGVFLPFLGCSRLFGGKSLASLSRKIAEDEFRHVLTNRTLLDYMGIDAWRLPVQLDHLITQTIDWAIGDLAIPEDEVDVDFNLDFVLEASRNLITTGEARDYDDVVFIADHVLPFEVSNASQYDRSLD